MDFARYMPRSINAIVEDAIVGKLLLTVGRFFDVRGVLCVHYETWSVQLLSGRVGVLLPCLLSGKRKEDR